MSGRHIEIRGVVQGVGFRPWVYRLARQAGISGEVWNGASGVSIRAFGSDAALTGFVRRLEGAPPTAAFVQSVDWRELEAAPPPDEFRIVTLEGDAEPSAERRVSIPADLATCERCLAEVFDPADRRHRYPFTNCTDCGPRYTIALDVPYDRPATTMAPFAMCDRCRQEYEDPGDRRFHAQPNACPECGPRLAWLDADGRPEERQDETAAPADALGRAVRTLATDGIVAVRGLGGFHLACRAASRPAVERLRRRKRRPAKPLAVMVADLATARRLAHVGVAEAELLTAPERPIVLLRQRSGPLPELADGVAPAAAPGGHALLGLMLPYTPLHHLLLADLGEPLVMTSGNRGGEPIAHDCADAVERLGGIADGFLVHDREIAGFCDDSVARVVDGAPLVLRRSRGWVPRPVALPRPLPVPVLACGGDLKNAFCLAVEDRAYLGPHVGDLQDLATQEAFVAAVERVSSLVGVEPEVVAHDLHPGYASVRLAASLPGRKVGVQHHHAHLVSCLAEHGRGGLAVGVVLDGTGFGTDGTAWGAEVLLGDAEVYRRLATTRALPLPGGETAVRQVWRLATALLWDAWDGDPPAAALSLVRAPAARRRQVTALLESDLPVPRVRGAGRYFDAVGALVLDCSEARHEGEVATALNLAVPRATVPGMLSPYPWEVACEAGLPTLDLRPTVRALVEERLAGGRPAMLAARFHATWVRALGEIAAAEAGCRRLPVALTGGCLANDVLSRGLARHLAAAGVEVLRHHRVPPGDGGLALGQAVAAGARVAADSQPESRDERSAPCA